MLSIIGMGALISVGVWLVGAIIAWKIYDIEGPKTSNVSAGIIMLAFQSIGKIAGTIFWPFVLLFKIVDFINNGWKSLK